MGIGEEIKGRLKQSSLNSLPRRWAHQGGSKTRIADCVVFSGKQTCLSTVYTAHVPSRVLRLNDKKRRHQTVSKKKNHSIPVELSASTRAVARALAGQPQLLLCAHPPVLSHGLGLLPIDNLHFGRTIVVILPMAQLPTSHTWTSLLELVEPGRAIFR